MLVIDALEPGLVHRLVLLPVERPILLGELVQRGREADVVLAVLGRDGERVIARPAAGTSGDGRRLAAGQPFAGMDALQLGDRDDVAGLGLGELGGLVALHREQGADAHMLAAARLSAPGPP